MRRTHYARQHQGRRPVTIFLRELRQAAGVAIDYSSRRDAMDELASPKPLVAQRAGERRRPRSDDFLNVGSRALKLAHNFQQAIIAGVRRPSPFSLRHSAVLAVIVVQPAELESGIGYSARQADNFSGLALLDPGAIHARIYIEENSHPAAAPLTHLLVILGQNGNAHFRKLLSYLPRPARICAHCRIREE